MTTPRVPPGKKAAAACCCTPSWSIRRTPTGCTPASRWAARIAARTAACYGSRSITRCLHPFRTHLLGRKSASTRWPCTRRSPTCCSSSTTAAFTAPTIAETRGSTFRPHYTSAHCPPGRHHSKPDGQSSASPCARCARGLLRVCSGISVHYRLTQKELVVPVHVGGNPLPVMTKDERRRTKSLLVVGLSSLV
jgi:hypothetical protein